MGGAAGGGDGGICEGLRLESFAPWFLTSTGVGELDGHARPFVSLSVARLVILCFLEFYLSIDCYMWLTPSLMTVTVWNRHTSSYSLRIPFNSLECVLVLSVLVDRFPNSPSYHTPISPSPIDHGKNACSFTVVLHQFATSSLSSFTATPKGSPASLPRNLFRWAAIQTSISSRFPANAKIEGPGHRRRLRSTKSSFLRSILVVLNRYKIDILQCSMFAPFRSQPNISRGFGRPRPPGCKFLLLWIIAIPRHALESALTM